MRPAPTPDFETLSGSLRRFLTEEVIPLQRRERLELDLLPPRELRLQVRRRSRELGFYGIDMPAEVGGGGASFATRIRVEIEAFRHLTPFFDDIVGGPGGPTPVLLACAKDQRARYLEPLVSGERTTCFALTEPGAGSDATALRTRAERRGDRFVVNGAKSVITNAVHADFALVFAVTDPERGARGGISCLIVDADTPGYRVVRGHDCMGFRQFQGELAFEDCEVPAENLLGAEGFGFASALAWINTNRVRTSAMALGHARGLLDRCIAHARSRSQFGRPIGTFQAIQLQLANMATELFAGERMALHVAEQVDAGADIRTEAAMTKLYCTEMVNRAAATAVQVHGAAGCLREGEIESIYRQVRVLTIVEGTSDIQRLAIARALLR
jgi:alkylation response protein AidB-like acyl-CoA dehydrogenase